MFKDPKWLPAFEKVPVVMKPRAGAPSTPPNSTGTYYEQKWECSSVGVARHHSWGMVHHLGSMGQGMKQWHGLPRIAIRVTLCLKGPGI